MPNEDELERAFRVYFEEIERCRTSDCYWALLHVIVSLPDICGALESENNWATEDKYVAWYQAYLPNWGMTPKDYRDIRNLVLHQGQTRSRSGRYYKFTKPNQRGMSAHRVTSGGEVMVLDVGKLATEAIEGIRRWFRDLQGARAKDRHANVTKNLPSLVTVKEQELPGITGATFQVTHTTTDPPPSIKS